MSDGHEHVFDDRTPGVEEHEPTAAILATIASFVVSQTTPASGRLLRSGLLIIFLVITGSVWIIANRNSDMMPMTVQ